MKDSQILPSNSKKMPDMRNGMDAKKREVEQEDLISKIDPSFDIKGSPPPKKQKTSEPSLPQDRVKHFMRLAVKLPVDSEVDVLVLKGVICVYSTEHYFGNQVSDAQFCLHKRAADTMEQITYEGDACSSFHKLEFNMMQMLGLEKSKAHLVAGDAYFIMYDSGIFDAFPVGLDQVTLVRKSISMDSIEWAQRTYPTIPEKMMVYQQLREKVMRGESTSLIRGIVSCLAIELFGPAQTTPEIPVIIFAESTDQERVAPMPFKSAIANYPISPIRWSTSGNFTNLPSRDMTRCQNKGVPFRHPALPKQQTQQSVPRLATHKASSKRIKKAKIVQELDINIFGWSDGRVYGDDTIYDIDRKIAKSRKEAKIIVFNKFLYSEPHIFGGKNNAGVVQYDGEYTATLPISKYAGGNREHREVLKKGLFKDDEWEKLQILKPGKLEKIVITIKARRRIMKREEKDSQKKDLYYNCRRC